MPARRKSVELSIKKQAIDWIATEGGGVPSRAEAHFRGRGWRISASSFRDWWRKREEIWAAFGSRRRLEGAGRRPVLGEAEDTLVEMIYDLRLNKEKVTRDWIAAQARHLFQQSRTEEEEEEPPIRLVSVTSTVHNFERHGPHSMTTATVAVTATAPTSFWTRSRSASMSSSRRTTLNSFAGVDGKFIVRRCEDDRGLIGMNSWTLCMLRTLFPSVLVRSSALNFQLVARECLGGGRRLRLLLVGLRRLHSRETCRRRLAEAAAPVLQRPPPIF